MYWLRRCTIFLTLVAIVSFTAWYAPRALNPTKQGPEKRASDRRWVNSSPYFLDRQACRWLGLCGLHHLRKDPAAHSDDNSTDSEEWGELRRRKASSWEETEADGSISKIDKKRNVRERRRVLKDIPDYVLKHAPLVHLYSGEEFWPSDIKEHVEHMSVNIDGELLNTTDEWTLHNLHKLNQHEGKIVLHSNDDVESRPSWLHSHYNVPEHDGDDQDEANGNIPRAGPDDPLTRKESTTWYDVDKDHPLHRIAEPRPTTPKSRFRTGEQRRIAPRGHKPDEDGHSKAPAVLIVVDKGSGVVDAFWFFFYSYNLGQTVLGVRFGNHVGDWEHCMMRFENGEPRGIFFSEHEGGQAFAWEAVEKRNDRPVLYSAVGSHAMYALPGEHSYILPFRLLSDRTDKGPLWDPALNNYAYHYDYELENPKDTKDPDDPDTDSLGVQREPRSLVPASSNPTAPTSWFHYRGHWGDDFYSLADPRQWRFFGQYHYVLGPGGPKFKGLDRSKLCQRQKCQVLHKIDPKAKWY